LSTTIAALSITAVSCSFLAASPSSADPDISDVEARVEALYHEAEQASERFNGVRLQLQETRSRLDRLERSVRRSELKVDAVRDVVAASVVAQYQGEAVSSTAQVLLADDPDEFLSHLTTVSAYHDQQHELMVTFADETGRLEKREARVGRKVARIAEAKRQLGVEKAEIDEKAGQAEELLRELKAEERARAAAAGRASREAARERLAAAEASEVAAPATTDEPSAPDPAPEAAAPAPAASGGAAAAVSYALAQVGDAYVYGATGESAFDCSGLTMRAWAQAGVTLPHQSTAQMSAGTPVSTSELQPGDLVFYYSPVSHVGMYIGGGQLVHAANPSSGVNITSLTSMPIAAAVRPG
jgi:cell wall-associated NlpC family hydrolase